LSEADAEFGDEIGLGSVRGVEENKAREQRVEENKAREQRVEENKAREQLPSTSLSI
jgi:hypothetical protein